MYYEECQICITFNDSMVLLEKSWWEILKYSFRYNLKKAKTVLRVKWHGKEYIKLYISLFITNNPVFLNYNQTPKSPLVLPKKFFKWKYLLRKPI